MVAATAAALSAAGADVIYGLNNDTDARSDATVLADTATTLLPGSSGSPAHDRSAVLVFQLPNLGAVPSPFTSSLLRFHLSSKTGTPPNADLYGLGRRASATVLASDYYGQTATADPADATLIQKNILTSSTANGIVSTGSTSAALKNYLNAQYAGGAGAGEYVFLRLSSDSGPGGSNCYTLTSADGGAVGAPDTRPQIIYNVPTGYTRPFIWVRDSEKAGILSKIANNAWAASVYDGMVSRVAADVSSHQSDRDTFLRGLPVEDWAAATPKFKTIPAYSESSVRYAAEAKFNDAQDCAILYYLSGDAKYARCAGDILHNVIKTMLPVAASTSTSNGGWIFQNDLLKEARVTGPQMAIVYDFLYSWLQTNQVYDVKSAGLVNFNFEDAQSYFRRYYQLVRDHGQKESNWSALMATTMLNSLLALDDATERNTAIQVYLTTGTSRQASLDYDYRHYTEQGDIWPESFQYAGAVGSIRSVHMVLLERVDPNLNLFNSYPNLPLSLPRISYFRYPGNNEQISFGDGHRSGGSQPYSSYELVYQHAKQRGRTDLTTFFGSLINGGVAEGSYNRSSLRSYGSLSMRDEPLQLLWQYESLSEPSVTPELPRTDKLPFAGITLQRNLPASDSTTYGLMCFVGGAGHIHSHASGMSMEIFGMGEVMGAKSGTETYGTNINENYYRLFAANNTVIVNGASRGEGGWNGFGINTVQTVAMEPQPFATAVSPNFSFTTSSFDDDKGTLAEGTQQRTMAIVRTSATTGYYVDVFRSKSTVTNRTATTLNGSFTNQYHDYIYRNIGETAVDLRADGVTLPLTSQPNRFQNDIGDANDQPGWRYFTNTTVSYPTAASMKAQFVATVSGTSRYMSMHMPAVASREYAKVDSPPIVDAPSPYNTRNAPTLVVRQIGDTWDKPFATVYEPHYGSTGGTVRNVTQLVRGGIVVGVKVESAVGGKSLVQYIISNPNATETYTDSSVGLSFTGRFGIASSNGDGTVTLYLGEGSSLSYRGNSVTTVSGSNSQAEARFVPGVAPVVTANTAVNAIAAPPPPSSAWVPSATGTFYWNKTANWNPAVIPNAVGYVAKKNVNLAGNQTVNLDAPATLGELVVGDSSGGQNTTLQKGKSGALAFDQTDNEPAYLSRTADGTGSVTLASDLNIALIDDLTVRLAGGTASSAMLIAGTISGSGKNLTKDGSGLTLSLAGANTYSGETRVSGGILSLENPLAIQNSTLDATNSLSGGATDGLRTTVASLTLGGLSGTKSLASLFTTTSGGYSTVSNLTLNPGAGQNPSYSGTIANGAAGMGLTKTGDGVQTLSGSNTFTGTTTINAGKLLGGVGGNFANSTVTLANASATFGVSITDNTKTWTCPAFSCTAAGTLEFAFGSILPGEIKPLTVTGLANFSVTPSVRVVVDNGLAAGTYPLMSWGSITGTAPSLFSVVKSNGTRGLSDGTSARLSVSGNILHLVITGTSAPVKANNTENLDLGTSWAGGVAPDATSTSRWNSTVTAANTTLLGSDTTWAGITIENPVGPVTINAGNTLTLGANANDINMSGATADLTLNCPLILGDAHTWNVASGRTLTLAGVVSGAFPVTKESPGAAILSAVNTFTGDISIPNNSGILEIGGSGRLQGGSYAGGIEIGSGSTFKYNSSAAQTLSGAISGDGTLNKSSSSTLTLSGANTAFTGPITINSGMLSLGSTTALGGTTAITLSGGTTLTTQATGITTTAPITLGTATATISFSRNTSAQGSLTVNSPISGSGNLTFTTPDVNSGGNLQTIFLGAENTYAGTTLITAGSTSSTLSIRATVPNALPPTTVLTLNGGNGSGSGRTVTFDLNGFDQNIAGLTNTISTLTARNQRITNSSVTQAVLIINNTADFTFGGTGISSTFNGNPVNPTAQITGNLELNKMGTGKFTLAAGAGNSFTGATAVLEGVLSVGHSTSLQDSPLDTLNSVTGDATNGLQTTVTTLTLGGLLGDKNLASIFTTTSGGYSDLTALTLNPGSTANHEYTGIIANGAAGMTLTKSGAGIQMLAGANTYTGNTTINAGGLNIQSPGALGTGAAGTQVLGSGTASSSNARLELQGGITIASEALNIQGAGNYLGALTSVSGNNEWAGNVTIGAADTRIGASAGATLKISGVIDSGTDVFGPGIRSSDLTGIVVLSAANTYLGDTTLYAGKLQLEGGDNRLPVTGKLILGSGTSTTEFDLNARNQKVAGLSITSGATAANNAINNSSNTLSTLTVDTASASPSYFDGTLKGNLALVKTGADTLTLTGANTYSGDTTVMQGTLSLGSANNANDGSGVNVAQAEATLNLAFAGSDTVAKLFVGGIQKPAGIYGAIGSASPVIGIPQITGAGTLTVTSSPVSGYGTWSAANAGGQGAELDFDLDGVANGIEYILGGSDSTNDLAKLPTVNTTGGNFVFSFMRDQDSIGGMTSLVIEVSADLIDWSTGYPVSDGAAASVPGVTVTKNSLPGFDRVTLSLPKTELSKFARLKVTP